MTDVHNLFGFSQPRLSASSLLSFTELGPKVQRHLQDVYRKLALGVVIATLGVAVSLNFHIFSPFLTAIASAACLYVMMSQAHHSSYDKRLALFSGFCFFKGMTIAQLVYVALHVDPLTVLYAVGATAVVFASFSVVALTARRREYLYLGGTLAAGSSLLAIAGLLNLFLGSQIIFNAQVWLGLLIFVGWVVFDTQLIIEKAREPNPDSFAHAAELFVDLVAIFVRILIIMLRNREEDKRRR